MDREASSEELRQSCATLWKLFSDCREPDLPVQFLNIVAPWLGHQPLGVQTRCIAVLGGASPESSRTIVRWLSWHILTGREWKKKPIASHPPLVHLLKLFTHSIPEKSTFSVHSKTDYTALAMRAEILGHLLKGVDGFGIQAHERETSGFKGASDLSLLLHALNDLHPKIRGCLYRETRMYFLILISRGYTKHPNGTHSCKGCFAASFNATALPNRDYNEKEKST